MAFATDVLDRYQQVAADAPGRRISSAFIRWTSRSRLVKTGRDAVWWCKQASRTLYSKGANIRCVTLARRKPAGKAPSFRIEASATKSPAGIEEEADVKNTYAISTAALLALFLAGTSARAQEPVSPATAAAGDESTTVTPAPPPPATISANSKIRIVRLSESKGEVQLDRKLGKGFEGAMANLPIIEGARLKTAMGVAEVEFEDNSTVRVAPNSLIEFTQLELTPTGTKVSGINVVQGMVYVSLMNNKGNDFTVTAGKDKITLPPDSHVRLQLAADQAHLAVLHGDATVQGEGVQPG